MAGGGRCTYPSGLLKAIRTVQSSRPDNRQSPAFVFRLVKSLALSDLESDWRSAVIDAGGATAPGASCHTCDAHWCQGAPDDGFGRRNPAVNAWHRELFAKLGAGKSEDAGEQQNSDFP